MYPDIHFEQKHIGQHFANISQIFVKYLDSPPITSGHSGRWGGGGSTVGRGHRALHCWAETQEWAPASTSSARRSALTPNLLPLFSSQVPSLHFQVLLLQTSTSQCFSPQSSALLPCIEKCHPSNLCCPASPISSPSTSFLYICICVCVFVYLCICVFVYFPGS